MGVLRARSLERQLEVDARPWTPLGAVPEPASLGRPGYRVLRPDDQRSVDWRARRNPTGQQRRVEQEALRSPSRICLPDERIDGDSGRLRDHLPLASLGRSGASWLVPVDRHRGVRGLQRIRAGDDESRLRRCRGPERPAGARGGDSFDLLPRHQHGAGSAAKHRGDGIPGRQSVAASRLHPVVESDRGTQVARSTGGVHRIRRVGVSARLRVPRHQRLADPRLGRRRPAALPAIRSYGDHQGV